MPCIYCYTVEGEHNHFCPRCGSPLKRRDQPQQPTITEASPITGRTPGVPPWKENSAPLNQPPAQPFKLSPLLKLPTTLPPTTPESLPAQTNKEISLLPVPVASQALQVPAPEEISLDISTQSNDAQALANPRTFYVPKGYTKPRPVIPMYRVISGFLSLLLVSVFACAGLFYYTGQGQLVLNILRPGTASNAAQPDQAGSIKQIETGPAYLVIPSAHFAVNGQQTTRQISANQPFTLVYHVEQPQTAGVVKTVWYKNDTYFKTILSPQIAARNSMDGSIAIIYTEPAQGRVELYWNDQLAETISFTIGA